ncbi:cobalt-precorrin-6A reductase [Marinibacterium profundimaris]|uniref:Cobalt-precorrin-6X reductase n=1 Tax=Marinibacterium profundimaris TaxID=1679460 RepID=A0A225NHN0_9RHOB|nr:cobalt-precorrin-6A reductase [Marinibacterium profundimaris]OWU72952.1 cobalt-precorrin-6X reductase [Marinibacterium profundimaris]
MRPNLLILGGTSDATALAGAVARAGFTATLSLAGRVDHPIKSPLPQRIGGFGGAQGLAAYLAEHEVTHLIDATHPFAAQMSRNAITAAEAAGVPLVALTRPAWRAEAADHWIHVPDMSAAVAALDGPAQRIFLAIGRQQLTLFADQPQHHYVLRLVDPPTAPLPLPDCEAIVSRGPFALGDDLQLLKDHRIDCVVSKNSGGSGAYAKIAAARALSLPVVMVDRPELPERLEMSSVEEVRDWVHQATTLRGV